MANEQEINEVEVNGEPRSNEQEAIAQLAEATEKMAALSLLLENAEKLVSEIQSHSETAEETSSLINEALETATADAGRAREILTDIQTRSSEIQAALPTVIESLKNCKVTAKEIDELHDQSETHASSIEEMVPNVEEASKRVAKHEQDLAELKHRIEDLLPGATSAGLAKAFQDQKDRFYWPKMAWMIAFFISILALVGIAAFGVGGLLGEQGVVAWQTVLLYLLRRLPLAAPLVWLAYFAGRRYMDAERLEVDYGYKEAISSAFEGYKKQMNDLGAELDLTSPLATLCNNQLRSIAEHPGRIYSDGHGTDITLATPIGELLQNCGEFAKQLKNIPPTTPWAEALPKIITAVIETAAKR